ncbi:guided entry of tail-anchored proteins factor 1-like [Ischnura elegans]|uniref:guided entry of tail-anchored proteins factor 1-like n=1 Tax=Ischnura elegans TaxID=197161 RepID=UPI001ED86D04|nr:guided entry of tail-anchored proteins factor 1-like [Ischnura elegans]XP_046392128.1 guided entry of tail-anchored proteins factor 1-like [Ischnura elegans]
MELLLFSLFCSIVSAFVPLIVRFTINYVHRVSAHEVLLQNEAFSIKKEMDGISIVDEFAKHAKLQRKLIKIKDELKKLASARLSTSMKQKFLFTYVMHGVMGLLLVCIAWLYRSVPVIVFPPEKLWPLTDVISWPTGVPGGVSIAVWIFVTNRVSRALAAYVTKRFFTDARKGTSLMPGLGNLGKLSAIIQNAANEVH